MIIVAGKTNNTLDIINNLGGSEQHKKADLVDACIIEPDVSDPLAFSLDVLESLNLGKFAAFMSKKSQPAKGKGLTSFFGSLFYKTQKQSDQPVPPTQRPSSAPTPQ